jgi:hypothetical protein
MISLWKTNCVARSANISTRKVGYVQNVIAKHRNKLIIYVGVAGMSLIMKNHVSVVAKVKCYVAIR